MNTMVAFLLRLFPAAFRERFGPEIREQVEQDWARERPQGAIRASMFAFGTMWNLFRTAMAERWQPTWGRAPVAPLKEKTMLATFGEWTRDIRHALRTLRRTPGFTAITVGTLGLAIGANAGLFSVVNAVLLDPLPFPSADRLVHIAASAPGSDFPTEFGVAQEFYVQYREESRLLEDVSTYNSFTSTLRVGDRVERIRMSWPTNSLFSTLGTTPIIGRLPLPEDGTNTAVISHALWQNWFSGDSSVVGRTYSISGASRTIIGVMGPEFRFPDDGTLLWISSEIRPEGITPGRFGSNLVARMAPGATLEAVAEELTTLSKRLPERFGGSAAYARIIEQHRAVVRPWADQLLGPVARPVWVLFAAAAFVLVIAWANVANLFMVRAEGRQRDLAVRRAIGAGRSQLMRLQMTEAVVVAVLGGILALVLALVALPAFVRAAPEGVPRIGDAALGGESLTFLLVATLLSAVACGFVPALRASAPDLMRLREGGRGTTRRSHWVRGGLVMGQTAMALVLLIGSGLLLRSHWRLSHVDPGYDTENIFTFQIAPEGEHLQDGPAFARFAMDFMERLRALPGVESVGLVENVPLNEGTAGASFRTEGMTDEIAVGPQLRFTYAAGDYLQTMGIDLLRGRSFTDEDQLTWSGNVILSRSAAEALWPGMDPIGRRLQDRGLADLGLWATVVGVVEDVRQNDYREEPQRLLYYPIVGPTPRSWVISSPAYVVKTPRASEIAPEVRALVREVAPEAPMYRVFTMEGLVRDSMAALSFTMLTLAVASGLALLLGALGLYGVLSYTIAERTREIGVRMALGAEATRVRRMVVVQGTRVVAGGITLGVGVALVATRTLGTLLFEVGATDLATYTGTSLAMIGVGLLASYLPARRASNIDPLEAMRSE